MGERYILPELLDKYLAGTCTPEESVIVEDWYRSFETEPEIGTAFPVAREDRYARSVFHKIGRKIRQSEHAAQEKRRFGNISWLWYAAATLALILGILWVQRDRASLTVASKNPGTVRQILVSLVNNTGNIQLKTLPDGSKVWLNPASRIDYEKNYGRNKRQISLQGEAFFEVVHNTASPFIILTGKMTTEVLGTSFNVQARRESKHFEVSVVTGTVAVSGPSGKKIIKARQQVRFDPVSGQLNDYKHPVITPYQIWEPVTINFEWASMKDVTGKLEEMFAVHFEFENASMKDCFLRADFTNLRLPVILDLLCQSTGASYTISNGVIRLTGPGC